MRRKWAKVIRLSLGTVSATGWLVASCYNFLYIYYYLSSFIFKMNDATNGREMELFIYFQHSQITVDFYGLYIISYIEEAYILDFGASSSPTQPPTIHGLHKSLCNEGLRREYTNFLCVSVHSSPIIVVKKNIYVYLISFYIFKIFFKSLNIFLFF
jgi:hypothetical protein